MKKFLKSAISLIAIITTIAYVSPVYAISNKETVYSKMNSNGEIYKTIVTTKEGEEVKQEETEKDLPIEAKISYELDGKDIKPEDLTGKSGKVKIKIEYKNKSSKSVIINGRRETLYTPFMVALGTVINNKNNKNIKVSKAGRIVENGEKTIVVGIVFPGLEESLNLGGRLAKVDVPDKIEITMDSNNFEMSNIITYATPKVLTEDIDWSKLDELFDKVNELQSGINKIEDGAKELNKGTSKLDDGVKDLKKGTSKVYDGSKEIKKQVLNSVKSMENNKEKVLDEKTLTEIGEKASKQASTSIEKEVDGIKDLAEKGAVKEVKKQEDTILNGAMSLIKNKIETKMPELVTGISKGITKAMESQLGTLEKQAVQAGTSSIDLSGLSKIAKVENIEISVGNEYKDSEDYKKLDKNTREIVERIVGKVEKEAKNEVNEVISAQEKEIKEIAKKAATTSATVTSKGLSSRVISGVAEASAKETANQIVSQMSNKEVQKTISTKLEDMAKQVAGGTAESVAKQIAPSVAEKTAISVASSVSEEVKTEVLKQVKTQLQTLLDEGLTPLTAGIKELDKGVSQLKEGTSELNKGAGKLSDGITKFDSEGISKISNFVNIDLQNLVTRGKKLEQLAKEYDKFSSDEKREDINFISLVDSIKNDEKQEDEKSN